MSESYEEQLNRLNLMADDDGTTWDLSDNDQAAISAILDRLDELEALTEWRPIETAPKDGTPMLVTLVRPDGLDYGPQVGRFSDDRWRNPYGTPLPGSPTHWRPLSAGPEGA